MWEQYVNATGVEEVLDHLALKQGRARIVAGATDLMLELERGVRTGIDTLIDISRIPYQDEITLDEEGFIHLGPLVTHNHCVSSKLIREHALPLALAAWEVGSPQIRNRGTIAGNLITASPANDTITPLMALGAQVRLVSKQGDRMVPLEQFYTGVRKTVMKPDEMLSEIVFPAMQSNQQGSFIKFALRNAQAISLVNVAVAVTFQGDVVESAAITLGSVAPTIIHAREAEEFLVGKTLDAETIKQAAALAMQAGRPISDVRASANYRKSMTQVIVQRALKTVAQNAQTAILPDRPVMLWGKKRPTPSRLPETLIQDSTSPIETTINGKQYTFTTGQDKSLLRLLREEAGLTGSKEGCAEGECGACTVFLDGIAVMSCMVPAPRAHGAEITTVEGVSTGEQMHPIQEAFIAEDAVQCGYCTPGFIMSGVKLLEERENPTMDEIRQAFTGNLCRCTGYYKIIQAVERAAAKGASDG